MQHLVWFNEDVTSWRKDFVNDRSDIMAAFHQQTLIQYLNFFCRFIAPCCSNAQKVCRNETDLRSTAFSSWTSYPRTHICWNECDEWCSFPINKQIKIPHRIKNYFGNKKWNKILNTACAWPCFDWRSNLLVTTIIITGTQNNCSNWNNIK